MKSVLFVPESNRDWDRIRMFVNEHYDPADIFRTYGLEDIGWDNMKERGGGVMFIDTHSGKPKLNRVVIGDIDQLRENQVGLEAGTTSQLTNIVYQKNRKTWESHRIITDTLVDQDAFSVTHEMEIQQIQRSDMGVVMTAGIGNQTAMMMLNPLLSSMSIGDELEIVIKSKTKDEG